MTKQRPPIPSITFTGLDEYTIISDAADLSRSAEIGILYSAGPKSRNRYPSLGFIEYAVPHLTKCAIHICGLGAREELRSGKLKEILPHVQRIQINGEVGPEELASLCGLFPRHEIITQNSPLNARLLQVKCDNHSILVDDSGGRGIGPKMWFAPDTPKPFGMAGGLGPRNMAIQLGRGIAHLWPWWIDMETKIRSQDDEFSIDLCKEVLKAVDDFYIPF